MSRHPPQPWQFSILNQAKSCPTIGVQLINPSDTRLDEESLANINKQVLVRIFWDDTAFFSSTLLGTTLALRLYIVNHTTTWNDVRETLASTERFGQMALADTLDLGADAGS